MEWRAGAALARKEYLEQPKQQQAHEAAQKDAKEQQQQVRVKVAVLRVLMVQNAVAEGYLPQCWSIKPVHA